ncbi:polysaccharide export protein [candidate division KSB1 bacterium]|nr:polysaccharide export protein [candidate division KSB1 bacterium]
MIKRVIFYSWLFVFGTLPLHATQENDPPLYRVGPGDVLEIKFFDNQRFDREVMVRPDGRITLEKVGDVLVAGKTTTEVDSIVTEQYRPMLKLPDVTIFIKYASHQKIYVSGLVNAPGGFPIEKNLSIMHAITLAGGSKRGANLKSVILIRQQANGKMAAQRVNVKKMFAGKDTLESVMLQALDVVYVPRSFIGNIDAFIDQCYQIILPPMDVFWRMWYLEQITKE